MTQNTNWHSLSPSHMQHGIRLPEQQTLQVRGQGEASMGNGNGARPAARKKGTHQSMWPRLNHETASAPRLALLPSAAQLDVMAAGIRHALIGSCPTSPLSEAYVLPSGRLQSSSYVVWNFCSSRSFLYFRHGALGDISSNAHRRHWRRVRSTSTWSSIPHLPLTARSPGGLATLKTLLEASTAERPIEVALFEA